MSSTDTPYTRTYPPNDAGYAFYKEDYVCKVLYAIRQSTETVVYGRMLLKGDEVRWGGVFSFGDGSELTYFDPFAYEETFLTFIVEANLRE